MKWLLFFCLSPLAFAQNPQVRSIDKVKAMDWDGKRYTVNLSNHQQKFVIEGSNAVIPCLENARKSEMQVLVTIDTDIPMIRSCKLYTPGIIKELRQAQEEPAPEATPSIPKR